MAYNSYIQQSAHTTVFELFSDLNLDNDDIDDDDETSKSASCSSMSSSTNQSSIKTSYVALNHIIEHKLVPDEEAWFKLQSQKSNLKI